jgi:hypothetical protein
VPDGGGELELGEDDGVVLGVVVGGVIAPTTMLSRLTLPRSAESNL